MGRFSKDSSHFFKKPKKQKLHYQNLKGVSMCPPKTETQKAFELHYLQQMREMKKQQKEDILDALENYIYDALSECDYVADNLIVSELNVEALYECVSFAINSIECATKELEKIQDLINDDEH